MKKSFFSNKEGSRILSVLAVGGVFGGFAAHPIAPVVIAAVMLAAPHYSFAQSITSQQTIDLPNPEPLFSDDSRDSKKKRTAEVAAATAAEQGSGKEVDFNAPSVEFDKEANTVKGSGGVLISGDGIQVQADSGQLDLTSKEATVTGKVIVSDNKGRISAESATLDVEGEKGEFSKAKFTLEEEGFRVSADSMKRLSEDEYSLEEGAFTTCNCNDGSSADGYVPWRINTGSCSITKEGYAHAYDTSLDMFGVPVFYTPYFGFPAKTERASGLLAPSAGISSEHGFVMKLPFFLVVDDSTDFTVSPFVETETRIGTGLEFRKTFSRQSKLRTRWIYSNESARGDDLKGTETAGLFEAVNDPTPWDRNRAGGFYSQEYRTSSDSPIDATFVADLHLVSDDLFLRELEDPEIGARQSRYTTSVLTGGFALGDIGSLTLKGEYNQSFEIDDDRVLQRLPEAKAQVGKTFRPFGSNPFGLKLVTKAGLTATDFVRQEGYDGVRTDVAPSVSIPFHFQNYFQSAATVGLNQTYYHLNNTNVPGTDTELDSSQDRTVPSFNYTMTTGVEKVFELERESLLTTMAALGKANDNLVLARVKHTVDPFVSYNYIPDTSQDSLPLFDSFDRIRAKSSFTYGVSTTLLGRFVPTEVTSDEIPELSPRVQDLQGADIDRPLDDIGLGGLDDGFGNVSLRKGEIRKLATLSIRQNYDYFEKTKDFDPNRDEFSDVALDLGLYPSSYLGVSFGTNYDYEDNQLTSWNMMGSVKSDRGDSLRTRVSYVREAVSQVEGNLEVVLTDKMKAAYYARFDDRNSEMIEQRAGVRMGGGCNCWHVDLGLSDLINPDRRSFMVSFTFAGLGDISQDFLFNSANSTR